MQTILGANGVIGKEVSKHLPRFTAKFDKSVAIHKK
jgi:hypothetical protein